MSVGTCPITVWDKHLNANNLTRSSKPCGQPIVAGVLCVKHEADRVRLGGPA